MEKLLFNYQSETENGVYSVEYGVLQSKASAPAGAGILGSYPTFDFAARPAMAF